MNRKHEAREGCSTAMCDCAPENSSVLLNSEDLRRLPLYERRKRLEHLLASRDEALWFSIEGPRARLYSGMPAR